MQKAKKRRLKLVLVADVENFQAMVKQLQEQEQVADGAPSDNSDSRVTPAADAVVLQDSQQAVQDAQDADSTWEVTLVKRNESDTFGFQLLADAETPRPAFIVHLTLSGLAEKTGNVHDGDRILAINGVPCQNILRGAS